MKRFLSVILSFVTVFSLLVASIPPATAASYYTEITSTETYNSIIEKIRSEENDYIAERIKLMIYGNEEYNPYGVGENWFNTSSYLTVYDGELEEYVNLRSAQCYGYANYVYHKLFGITCYDDGNTTVASISRGDMSASALKFAINKASCGSHIRGSNSHSLIFLTTDQENNGFYYLEANDYTGPYKVYLSYSTYSQFCSKYNYVRFIYSPESYPSYSLASNLTVADFSYPVNKKSGGSFSPQGKVTSPYDISQITVSIKNSEGAVLSSRTVAPCARYWDVAWFENSLFFSDIEKNGKYSYNISATDVSGASLFVSKEFTVSSSKTESALLTEEALTSTPSLAESNYLATLNEKTSTLTRVGDKFNPNGIINGKNVILKSTANVTIDGVKYYKTTDNSWISDSDVSPLKSLTVSKPPNKTSYMDYEALRLDGLKLTVACENGNTFPLTSGYDYFYDKSAIGAVAINVRYCGLSASFTINITKTDVVVGETYKVTENLRVRSHAGLSHEQLGTLPKGAVITVKEKAFCDEYTWGKVTYEGITGWCALEYAEYISGTIVNSLVLSTDAVTIENGKTYSINAVVSPSNAADTTLKFTSSDESVVKVDEVGLLTAVSVGNATVTVTTANGIKKTLSVFVSGPVDYVDFLNASFDIGSYSVTGIPISITAKEFCTKYGIAVYDVNGNTVPDSAFIATGMKIKYDGNLFDAIVLGDTNCDGNITSTDFIICRKYFLGLHPLDGVKLLAGDIDGDGRITSTDFLQIRRHYLQLYNIYA